MVARSMAEIMTEPLPETSEGTLGDEAGNPILKLLKGRDAMVLGPGISTHPETAQMVLALLPRVKVPMVIDADGLNILSAQPDLLKRLKPPVILTPHPGEFARLVQVPTRTVVSEKLRLAPAFAQKYRVYLVLKGYRTITATPSGRVFINPTGNPGMATGGSGDVLSGMIGSMIMQEKDLLKAVLSAVYLHGLSGDLAAQRFGEKSLVAGNLITFLAAAVKKIMAVGPGPC